MNKNNSQRGFSLIELLVALAIGSFLILKSMNSNNRETAELRETVGI